MKNTRTYLPQLINLLMGAFLWAGFSANAQQPSHSITGSKIEATTTSYAPGSKVSLTQVCPSPVNLTATLSDDHSKYTLKWEKENFEGAYLSYGNLIYSDAIGLNGKAPITVAFQFDTDILAEHDGKVFSKIKMFYGVGLGAVGKITIQIWEGNTLIREQVTTGNIAEESWNEFTFNDPVLIDGTKSYKVGYTASNYGGYPAGAQDYTGIPNSDLIIKEGQWDHFNNYRSNSWLIEAFVSSAGKGATDHVALTSKVIGTSGNAKFVSAPSVDLSRGKQGRSTREFMGYNVYRNSTLLNSQLLSNNLYEDMPASAGNYCYTVTAMYSSCESDPSNEVCVDFHVGVKDNELSNVKVYPNPSNSTMNIDLTGNVSQMVIYNYLGLLVYENSVTHRINPLLVRILSRLR